MRTVTVELPAESIRQDGELVTVTLDVAGWQQLSDRIARECRSCVGPDPGIVVLHAEQALGRAARDALDAGGGTPPDRRAVAAVLRCLADLVIAGVLRGFNTEWSAHEPGAQPAISCWFQSRSRAVDITIPTVP